MMKKILKIKFSGILLLTIIFLAACSGGDAENQITEADENNTMQNNYPNLVSVNPPEETEAEPSKVYVESVKVISTEDGKAILISGNFANSCTSLKKVSHSVNGNTLTITMKGWRPANKFCATVLTPYSFIFDELPPGSLADLKYVVVNDKQFEID